jgi:hypothetical protein
MPSQNRVRRDDRGDLAQDAPSQPMPQDGEPPPVVIRELEPLPTQLASKDPILCNQVGHGTSLLAIQPANHDREHHLESRRVDHGGSLYHSMIMVLFPAPSATCGTLRDRYEITFNDVPVGTRVSFRVNDQNACDETPPER